MKIETIHLCTYLDIEISGVPVGRIVIELYDDQAPVATRVFQTLCGGSIPRLSNTVFHRVIKNFMIQAGDTRYGLYDPKTYPQSGLGLYSESPIDGLEAYADENVDDSLDEPFKVCMAHVGAQDSNGLQFFITTAPLPHIKGKHTVFGHIKHGKSVVREMERVRTDRENVPLAECAVVISKCGEWLEGMPCPVFNASYDSRGGDIYEEYPDDDIHIDKELSESVYEACTAIKALGTVLFKEGNKSQAILKYKKGLRYLMEFFPDQDQEPEWYAKYMDMKKLLYLNLSLACLGEGDLKKTMDYSQYLLDMDEALPQDKAKAHFRRGKAYIGLKQYSKARDDFKAAHDLVPLDNGIKQELARCENIIQQQKQAESNKYARFFK